MHTLRVGNKEYEIAQSYNELTLSDLCYLYFFLRRPDDIQAVKTKMIAI